MEDQCQKESQKMSELKTHQGSAEEHFGLRAKMTEEGAEPEIRHSSPNNTVVFKTSLQEIYTIL